MAEWVYQQTESCLWTVGYYKQDGEWEAESDHGSPDEAAARVHFLNGGEPASDTEDDWDEESWDQEMDKKIDRAWDLAAPWRHDIFMGIIAESLVKIAITLHKNYNKEN